MQRRIVIGVVVLMLALFAGVFSIWQFRRNRPDKIWVPMPVNAQLTADQRSHAAADVKEKLISSGILKQVSSDLNLAEKWNLGSSEEASQELQRRLFVENGEADTPMGRVPCLNIGVSGKAKERRLLGDISLRLIKEVFQMLGIKQPADQGI